MLLVALAECWEQRYLPEHRVVRLLMTLLSSFLRSDGREATFRLRTVNASRPSRGFRGCRLLGGSLAFAALREQGEWRVRSSSSSRLSSPGSSSAYSRWGSARQRSSSGSLTSERPPNRGAPAMGERVHRRRSLVSQAGTRPRTRACRADEGVVQPPVRTTLSVEGSDLDDPRIVSLVRQGARLSPRGRCRRRTRTGATLGAFR